MRHSSWWVSLVCAGLLGAVLSTSAYSQQLTSHSKENIEKATSAKLTSAGDLHDAYVSELGSRDRYVVYATKADEEGYGQVASMFRAIARGEEIHASNLASLIPPAGDVKGAANAVEALTTEENLRTALAEQRYERDVMYPQYLKQVHKQKNKDLEKTLDRNMAAEPLHFAWYAQALSDLDGYKGGNVDFLVCPGCGNTVRSLADTKCPICGTPKDKFERVH